jgi:hypothetical protein
MPICLVQSGIIKLMREDKKLGYAKAFILANFNFDAPKLSVIKTLQEMPLQNKDFTLSVRT